MSRCLPYKTPRNIKVMRLMGTFFFHQINGNVYVIVSGINLVLQFLVSTQNGLFASWMADQWIMNHSPVALHLKHFNLYIFESQHTIIVLQTKRDLPTDLALHEYHVDWIIYAWMFNENVCVWIQGKIWYRKIDLII